MVSNDIKSNNLYITTALKAKLEALRANVRNLKRVFVAFSGGVDSSLLLYVAHEQLRENCLAISATSQLISDSEIKAAIDFCSQHDITHILLERDELSILAIKNNTPERCYFCKHDMFARLKSVAKAQAIKSIIEGSNIDDLADYRPGMKALSELGIISPLKDAKLCKAEIRQLLSYFGLPVADAASSACLATRFAFFDELTPKKILQVDAAETYLRSLGAKQVRVRHLDSLARIELDDDSFELLCRPNIRTKIVHKLTSLGYKHVAFDIAGYKCGSMNYSLHT